MRRASWPAEGTKPSTRQVCWRHSGGVFSVKEQEVNSNCCSVAENQPCSLPSGKPGLCPECRTKCKAVATLTVKSLVRDHTAVPAAAQFLFCRTPDCEVVYFSDRVLFKKPDLKVLVGAKETTGPVPLCYCFEYDREDIRRDMDATGNTTILEKIKAEVQGGFCACEVKNPSLDLLKDSGIAGGIHIATNILAV